MALPLVLLEDTPRWVRGVFAGQTIVDSKRAKLLLEKRHPCVYYFPKEDIRWDFLLFDGDYSVHCPTRVHTDCDNRWKGEATWWSIVVGDVKAEHAAWSYNNQIGKSHSHSDTVTEAVTTTTTPDLSGLVGFRWDAMGAWYEEDQEVFFEPRDPYHRVDVLPSSRKIQVFIDGVKIAESSRPQIVYETECVPRYYLPKLDVRMEWLKQSEKKSGCPYKGVASYWSVVLPEDRGHLNDVAWTYQYPIPAAAPIAGHISFYNERVVLLVDGVQWEKPKPQPQHQHNFR